MLSLYFELKGRSGGGPIKNLQMNPDKRQAWIRFENADGRYSRSSYYYCSLYVSKISILIMRIMINNNGKMILSHNEAEGEGAVHEFRLSTGHSSFKSDWLPRDIEWKSIQLPKKLRRNQRRF